MPYKNKLTTTSILIALREQLLTARSQHNREALIKLKDVFELFSEIAYKQRDGKVARILESMSDSVSDSLMGVEWKSEIPSVESILNLEITSAAYSNVQATIIRRAFMKKESRPPSLGYAANETGEYEIIDPDWISVARVFGPYKDTFDLLGYKSDGNLVYSAEFDTLEDAISSAKSKCSILETDWELCNIEIKDENGRVE